MLTGLLLLALAAGALVAGAELFAEHAGGAGRRLGVSALAVGIVLAGAEPEELVTAVIASLRDRPGLAVGDAIGANITTLTLVLGLAAMLRPVPVGGRVRGYAAAAVLTGLVATAVVADGRVSRLEGGLLVLAYAVFVVVVWRAEREPPLIGEVAEALEDDSDSGRGGRATVVPLVLVLVGIAIMTLGGRIAIAGAERIVSALSASDTAVGLTFVALATTAELLALVFAAARRQISDLAVAAVLGSATYNATATLGIAALARPLTAPGPVIAGLAAAALPAALIVAGGRRHRLGRGAGVALLAGYAAFVVLVLR
jgi:cation:H+ antiporter